MSAGFFYVCKVFYAAANMTALNEDPAQAISTVCQPDYAARFLGRQWTESPESTGDITPTHRDYAPMLIGPTHRDCATMLIGSCGSNVSKGHLK